MEVIHLEWSSTSDHMQRHYVGRSQLIMTGSTELNKQRFEIPEISSIIAFARRLVNIDVKA